MAKRFWYAILYYLVLTEANLVLYFFILRTSGSDLYVDKQTVYKSLFAYGVLRYLVFYMLTVLCCYILTMVYIPGK